MDLMLRKLRSIWRWNSEAGKPPLPAVVHRAVPPILPATGDQPAHDAAGAEASPPADLSAASTKHIHKPRSRAQRLTAVVTNLRGDMRTLESKIDTVQSRSDRLMQTIQSASPRDDADLGALRSELHALRSRLDEQAELHSKLESVLDRLDTQSRDLHSSNESLSNRLDRQTLRVTETQERMSDLSGRIEELQLVVHSTIENVNTTHAQLVARESERTREFTGRIIGLYVIGCVALTVALATLFILLARVNL